MEEYGYIYTVGFVVQAPLTAQQVRAIKRTIARNAKINADDVSVDVDYPETR